MAYPMAPTTQNLPSCCQLRTERSEASARRRDGGRVAAGRSTVAREGSASGASDSRDSLDPRAGGLEFSERLVLLYDERLDEAIRPEEQIAKLPELSALADNGTSEELAQRPRPAAIEPNV